jgi:hypothetical protein
MSEESKKLAKAIVALKSVDMGIRTRVIDAVKADEVEIAVGLSLEDDPPEFEKWVVSKGSGNTSPLLTCCCYCCTLSHFNHSQ